MPVGVTDPGPGTEPAPEEDEYELSGWWRRVGAVLVDSLVLLIPVAILAFLTHAYTTTKDPYTGSTTFHTSQGFTLLDLAVWSIYVLLLLPRSAPHNGQTLGKQALGIAIMRNDGYPLDLTTTSIRELLCKGLPPLIVTLLIIGGVRVASLLLLAVLLDYLWPLWDSENRALHDHIAQTHVVRRARPRYFRPRRP